MADEKLKMLSDEQLVTVITLTNTKLEESIKNNDLEKAQAWESILLDFMREQRSRDDQYSDQEKDSREFEHKRNHDYDELCLKRAQAERDWEKTRKELLLKERQLTDDKDKFAKEHELEVQKLNFEKGPKFWLGIGQIVATVLTTGGTIYSAWAGLKSKKIEYETKEECWNRICDYEDEGEITKRQAGQQIKL